MRPAFLARARRRGRRRAGDRHGPRRAAARPLAVGGTVGLVVAAFLLLALARHAVKAALLVGLFSVLFAYLVAPLSRRLHRVTQHTRRPLSRTQSILAVFLLLAAGALVAKLALWGRLESQVIRFIAYVPAHVEGTLGPRGLLGQFAERVGTAAGPTSAVATVVGGLATWVRTHVADVLADAAAQRWLVPWLGLVPLLAFLLLTEFPAFRRTALSALPAGHLQWRGGEFLGHVNAVLAGYTRAQLLSCLIVGSASAAGFALLQVPYALLIGLAAGVLEFVPLIGPITAALLVASQVRGADLVWAMAFLALLRVVQDYAVYPRLLGKRMHLPPALVIAAVVVGAMIGGIVGVLLAVPVVGVTAVALRHWREYREIAALLESQRAAATAASDNGGEATAADSKPNVDATPTEAVGEPRG